MVSMKDISAACNVSISTVSKALNDQSDISEETKQLVKQAAKDMGYFPNSSARALKTNRTYNIGVLFVDEAQSGLTHDYFSHVLDSFKVTAETFGYDITFIISNKHHKRKMTYLEHSRFRGFDGVVIACVNFDDSEVIELMQSDIPVVTIDYTFNNTIAILSNNVKGMKDLVSYVIEMGHTKIAYIHGTDSSVTRNRLSGYYITMEEHGLKAPDKYVKLGAYRDVEKAEKLTEELLDMDDPPTCIIYADDFSCFGGINAIKSRGLRIPEDISIAGYDGIPVVRHVDPPLTTVVQDTKKMGAIAAERLISLIEKPKTTVIDQTIIDGALFQGKSVKKIN